MGKGTVVAICIAPAAGAPLRKVPNVLALAGRGLEGDRYASGNGSFNKGAPGKRQVTLMNHLFCKETGYSLPEMRRNIFTRDVELMWLIGREFTIGEATFRGVKYCDPCERPKNLAGSPVSFQQKFFDRGGLVAEVVVGGLIRVGDAVIPPPKGY